MSGIRITNTRVKTFTRCPRQYHYKFSLNLAPNAPTLPLKRGTWMHELLATHYRGQSWQKKHKSLSAEYNKLYDEEKQLYGNLPEECARMMKAYLYNYRKEDAEMDILYVEQEFEAPLPHGHMLVFQPDLIVEDEYGIWLWEHKTHKTFPRADYRFLDIQTARYVYGLKKNGIDVMGIVWNYVRTKAPTVPHLNKNGQVSRRKIDTDLFTYVTALKSYGVDLSDYSDMIRALRQGNTFFRRERVPKPDKVVETLVKEAVVTADHIERGFAPIRSIQRSCEYDCAFKELCISDLYGGNTKALIKRGFHEREEGDYYGDEEVEELEI